MLTNIFGQSEPISVSAEGRSLHTVFCAECTSNFDWKSAGVFYTHRTSQMPGKITRLLACTEAQKKVYPKSGLEMGPTFVHPNYVDNPHNGESSGSYNKPASVMHWVREANISETFVLFIDADMLLRAPIDAAKMGVRPGNVISEHVHYLDNGIRRHLPENFLPDASAATFAKAAGWYHVFHIDDLRKIAPRWLHYCERMRTSQGLYWDIDGSIDTWHPLARRAAEWAPKSVLGTAGDKKYLKTGDDYVKYGEAPWISEMYGYVFAASEQRIATTLLSGLVQYTDSPSAQMPPAGPTIIHYGLHCHVDECVPSPPHALLSSPPLATWRPLSSSRPCPVCPCAPSSTRPSAAATITTTSSPSSPSPCTVRPAASVPTSCDLSAP